MRLFLLLIALLQLVPSAPDNLRLVEPVTMAASVTHKDAIIGTADPFSSNTISVTAGAVVLVTFSASVSSGDPGASPGTLGWTGSGTPNFTELGTRLWGSRRRTWWYTLTGVSGSGEVTVNHPSFQEVGFILDQATGVDVDTPIAGFVMGGANSGTSLSLTAGASPAAGDATYSSMALESNVDMSPDAGWDALGNTNTDGLGVRRIESVWDVDTDTTLVWSWSGNNGNGGAIWILKAAAAGGEGRIFKLAGSGGGLAGPYRGLVAKGVE